MRETGIPDADLLYVSGNNQVLEHASTAGCTSNCMRCTGRARTLRLSRHGTCVNQCCHYEPHAATGDGTAQCALGIPPATIAPLFPSASSMLCHPAHCSCAALAGAGGAAVHGGAGPWGRGGGGGGARHHLRERRGDGFPGDTGGAGRLAAGRLPAGALCVLHNRRRGRGMALCVDVGNGDLLLRCCWLV